MNVSDSNSSSAVNGTSVIVWENASLYYSLPSDDPELAGCKPIILKSELQVNTAMYCILRSGTLFKLSCLIKTA